MIVECGHCGAPLDVRGQARAQKCNYCGIVNERARARTIMAETPADFKPPKTWTPPPHVAADSTKPLEYKAGMGVGCFLAMFAVPFLIPLTIGVAECAWPRLHGATPESIAAFTLAGTPDQVADALSGAERGGGNTVNVTFKRGAAGPYDKIRLRWDEGHLEAPTGFDFEPYDDAKIVPAVRAALASRLHGGLDASGDWKWEDVRIEIDPKTGAIAATANTEHRKGVPNPQWRRQIAAMWQIVVSAAFGVPPKVTHEELVEVLGAGYPVARFAQLDTTVPVENMAAAVTKHFPGAVRGSDTSMNVAIDHPLFFHLDLSWVNEPAGHMTYVSFAETPAFVAGKAAFVSCLAKGLGAPKETVTDYVRQTKDYEFVVAGSSDKSYTRVQINGNHLVMRAWDRVFDPKPWTQTFTTLDRCR